MRRKIVMQNAILSEDSFNTLLEALKDEVKAWKNSEDIILSKSPILPIVNERRRSIEDISELSYWETLYFSATRRKKIIREVLDYMNPELIKESIFWCLLHDLGDLNSGKRSERTNLMRYFLPEIFKKYPRELHSDESIKNLIDSGLIFEVPKKVLDKSIDNLEFDSAEDLTRFFMVIFADGLYIDIKYRGIGNLFLLDDLFAPKTSAFGLKDTFYNAISKSSSIIDKGEYYRAAFEKLKKKGEYYEQEKSN